MANDILSGLSRGLRGIGAVMNPNVYQAQRQEEEAAANRDQRKQELLLGIIANGVQSGAIDPVMGKQVLAKAGFGDVPMGPSFDVQQRVAEQQKQEALLSGRKSAQSRVFVAPERGADINLSPVGPDGGLNTQQAGVGFADLASAEGVNNIRRPDTVEGGLNYGGVYGLGTPGLEMSRREETTTTAPAYDPRQDPAAWLAYADDRERAGDLDEAKRAYERAKQLEDRVAPKAQLVDGQIVTTVPVFDGGSLTGYSANAEPVGGFTPKDKDPWSGVTPSQYTPESLAAYKTTVDSGKPDRSVLRVNPKQTAEAGASKIINSMGNTAVEELVKGQAKKLNDAQVAAEQAVDSIRVIHTARAALDSGAFTGIGAKVALNFGRALSQIGFKAAEDPVANTQAYAANAGNLVGQVIKQFGSGTGLSDADRQYAERIAAGDITMDEKSLRKLLDINERASRVLLDRYNEKARGVDAHPTMKEVPYKFSIEVPPAYTPPPAKKAELYNKYNLERAE
jgi:hypothetical protein